MSNRKPRAKWVLPEIVDPPERVCYTVAVPKERQHIAAFWGALLNLASAAQWADDDAHTAKDVALVWRNVVDEVESGNCMDEPCGDVSVPFDPDLVGEFTLHIIAGHFAVAPTYIRPGDTLTLISAQGVWRDGMLFVTDQSNWYRFDGGDYTDILTPAPDQASDILPDMPHMALIGRLDDDGTPYHWQVGAEFGGANFITVPASVSPSGVLLEFFANGPLLSDSAYDLENFQPHGELCFTMSIERANLCPQVFINFDELDPPLYTLVLGAIVPTSPIADGPALQRTTPTFISSQAIIEVPTPGCDIRDVAFTVWASLTGTSGQLQAQFVAYNEQNHVIQNFGEEFALTDQTVESFTVTPPAFVEGVFKLRMAWTIVSGFNDQPNYYIDNVFVN